MQNRFYILMGLTCLILGCRIDNTTTYSHAGYYFRCLNNNSVSFYGWTDKAIKKSEGKMRIPEKIYNFDVVEVNCKAMPKRDEITEIVVPSTVKTIRESSFINYRNLNKIVLPEGLTSIEKEAFKECDSLREITLPDSLKVIPVDAFSGSGLSNVYLPKKLKTIYGGAFEFCYGLNNISLPDTLEEIFPYAFYDTSLNTITLPASLNFVGEYVFMKCKNLRSVKFQDTSNWYIKKRGDATWIPIDVSDPAKNAENFTADYNNRYAGYIWVKKR